MKKFKELLPLLTSNSISLRNRGKVFVTYVRSALLHASECWALKKEELLRLQRNERAMLRWILNFRITDRISSVELYRKLKIPTLESALRKNRLRWFGHTQRSDQWINKIQTFDVETTATSSNAELTYREATAIDETGNAPITFYGSVTSIPKEGSIYQIAHFLIRSFNYECISKITACTTFDLFNSEEVTINVSEQQGNSQ